MEEITTKQAVDHLCKQLVADKGYWTSWVANIAMSFQDEFREHHKMKGIWEISNDAAERFLKLLCREELKSPSPRTGGVNE